MCSSAWAIQRCPWLAAAGAESLHAAFIPPPERNRLLRRHSVAFLLRTFLHFSDQPKWGHRRRPCRRRISALARQMLGILLRNVHLGLGYPAVPLAGRCGRGKSTCCVYTAAPRSLLRRLSGTLHQGGRKRTISSSELFFGQPNGHRHRPCRRCFSSLLCQKLGILLRIVQLGLGYPAVPLAGRCGRAKSTCCDYTAAPRSLLRRLSGTLH